MFTPTYEDYFKMRFGLYRGDSHTTGPLSLSGAFCHGLSSTDMVAVTRYGKTWIIRRRPSINVNGALPKGVITPRTLC